MAVIATRTIIASGKRFQAGDALPAERLGKAGLARLVELGAAREEKGEQTPAAKKPAKSFEAGAPKSGA